MKYKYRLRRFNGALILLMLLCILPALPWLYAGSMYTLGVTLDTQSYLASVKGIEVEQRLNIMGDLKSFQILLNAPSGVLYQEGELITTIAQEGRTPVSSTVKAISVKSGLFEPNIDLGGFGNGEVSIRLRAEGLPEGTDLFVVLTDATASSLPHATMDCLDTGYTAVVSSEFLVRNTAYTVAHISLIVLFVVIVLCAWAYAFKSSWLERGCTGYLLCALLIFCTMVLRSPTTNVLAEPRSEAVYEFWYKAKTMGFWGSLFSLMSGESLTWVERIVTWLAWRFTPTKYVFVVAQIIELAIISLFTAMPVLPAFRRYFRLETSVLIALYAGCFMLFTDAYNLWSISYWVSFFLIGCAFLDLEKISRAGFVTLLLVTVICCVSRMYHIVFIPICLFLLLLVGRQRGHRFRIYCISIMLASAFEVVYSFLVGAGSHIEGTLLLYDCFTIIKNTLYYQVQVILSLFFGGKLVNGGLILNLLGLLIFAAIIIIFARALLKGPAEYPFAAFLGSMGMLSIGSIFINIYVCSTSTTVAFPHAYGDPVSWFETYYQQADLHFSYAYIGTFCILLALIWKLNQSCKNIIPKAKYLTGDWIANVSVALLCIFFCSLSTQNVIYLASHYPTDWKNECFVTQDDSYYIAVNADRGVAHISMNHNSYPVIYGMYNDGIGRIWNVGDPFYETDIPYHAAAVGDLCELESRRLLNITVRREEYASFRPLYVVLRARDGSIIERVKQSTELGRRWNAFYPETKPFGVHTLSFEYEDGTPAYIYDGLQLGLSTLP